MKKLLLLSVLFTACVEHPTEEKAQAVDSVALSHLEDTLQILKRQLREDTIIFNGKIDSINAKYR